MNLFSEFFYEGIRRIIPGFVVIILYWRKEAENIFHAHLDLFSSPYLFILCVLSVAWLIGFLVETMTFVPFVYVLRFFSLFCKCAEKLRSRLLNENTEKLERGKNGILKLILDAPLSLDRSQMKVNHPISQSKKSNGTHIDRVLKTELRRQAYFYRSIRIMCRCLWVTFLIGCFKSPEAFSNLNWHQYFYGIIGFIVFGLAWFWYVIAREID